jgi:hypothetical protein
MGFEKGKCSEGSPVGDFGRGTCALAVWICYLRLNDILPTKANQISQAPPLELRSKQSAIGVQAAEQEVHPQVKEDHPEEPNDGNDSRPFSSPSPRDAGVEETGIDQPDYQGPGLLGVPTPVRSPGIMGPNGPR